MFLTFYYYLLLSQVVPKVINFPYQLHLFDLPLYEAYHCQLHKVSFVM